MATAVAAFEPFPTQMSVAVRPGNRDVGSDPLLIFEALVTSIEHDAAALDSAAQFNISYVPSPRKKVVVLFGHAGNAPDNDAVAVFTSAVSWILVNPAHLPLEFSCTCPDEP